MNPNRIERIFDSGCRAVLVTTGGGSSALNALLTTPGASRFVADAQIPYSPAALERFLGEKPEQSVSPATARKLAAVSFEKAIPNPESQISNLIGVSCTAALQTDRQRRGDDRAFICIKTEKAEKLYVLYLSESSREKQEALLSDWLLVLIAQAVGAERGLMLPGSFNPVHCGHFGLLKAAEEMSGLRGIFELSVANVDKPDISEEEILRRAASIRDIPVALTQAPLFTQKAELFPRTTFVLGHDTAERLIENNHTFKGVNLSELWTRSEAGSESQQRSGKNQWEKFQALETKFLVAGRIFQALEKMKGGGSLLRQGFGGQAASFQTLEKLELPKGFEALFESIPEPEFREDISSTELRKTGDL